MNDLSPNSEPENTGTPLTLETQSRPGMSRREFLHKPPKIGLGLLVLNALGLGALAGPSTAAAKSFIFPPETTVPIRNGLGVVVVGASSGMGAEVARQYASHGAYVVLAARRVDKLNAVAAEVTARGGTAHIVVTDVRDEAQCGALIQEAITWLGSNGKAIDVLVLGALRNIAGIFGPELASSNWQNDINTSYYGPAHCLRFALPHLKAHRSNVVYLNTIGSGILLAGAFTYNSFKRAWRGIIETVQLENPELTTTQTFYNAVDTEAWDKANTLFANDKRYCPSTWRTYVSPTAEMYTVDFAAAKLIQAIESKKAQVFLSYLNQASWLTGPFNLRLGGVIGFLELTMRPALVLQTEAQVRQKFAGKGANGYVAKLQQKLGDNPPRNELIAAAILVQNLDPATAYYLLALDDILDPAILNIARQRLAAYVQSAGDGTARNLFLGLSAGIFNPPGIADDLDGFAPITDCPPAGLP